MSSLLSGGDFGRRRSPRWGFGLFIGGAAANVTEQIAFGGVTDYISISWLDDYLVNVSDLAIIAGAALLAIALFSSLARR